MEILNQRINVKAVKAYQTVEMEMTVSNATNEEIAQVKAYLLNEAKTSVCRLADDIEGRVQVPSNNTQQFPQKKTPTYRTDSNYQQPQAPVQQSTQAQQSNVVMVDGFAYKHCVNKQTGERFLALVNPDDLNRGAKKYVKE